MSPVPKEIAVDEVEVVVEDEEEVNIYSIFYSFTQYLLNMLLIFKVEVSEEVEVCKEYH